MSATTTSGVDRSVDVMTHLMTLHLLAEAGPERERYYWERSGALDVAEMAGLLPADRHEVMSTIQARTVGHHGRYFSPLSGALLTDRIRTLAGDLVTMLSEVTAARRARGGV